MDLLDTNPKPRFSPPGFFNRPYIYFISVYGMNRNSFFSSTIPIPESIISVSSIYSLRILLFLEIIYSFSLEPLLYS